ncbi:hypothetical protein HG537_0G02640 [Torulaspora globosa]|uniref:Ty3 transposon capsid-like protein domain-containing protein n=1 Tax=Torulaspora globosa TaxID=48254 RepID=A0A7H9HXB0_9SACH|nr:hypothetical protein HG537_0G02640 [Torulaspora sp. CBS 2947]
MFYFEGSMDDSHKLEKFIKFIMVSLGGFDWSGSPNVEASRVLYMSRHLRGSAARWAYDYMSENDCKTVSFDDFINRFRTKFYREPDAQGILNVILNLSEAELGIQPLNEKFREYWYRLPEGYMSERAAVDFYARCLEPFTYSRVCLGKPTTLPEIMEEAYQTIPVHDRFFPDQGDSETDSDSSVSGAIGSQNTRSKRFRNQRASQFGKRLQGPSKDVKKPFCSYCKRKGHSLNKCRTRKASYNRN